ncbi:MAG: phage tail tape measure protein [Dehalobacter sp.]|nr:phage tail tape measure protein [Dehalobacter sp.]
MPDNAMLQIISRIGVDYSQALLSTRQLASETAMLDKQLKMLRVTAADLARVSNTSMATQLLGDRVIYDQYGRALSIVGNNTKEIEKATRTVNQVSREHVRTVKDLSNQYSVLSRVFNPNVLFHHANWLLTGAMIFGVLETMKKGLIDVERGMKGLQTVLPEIAHDQTAYNAATQKALDLTIKYGADLDDTMNSARSFGRMYKDLETVMGLTNDAILLNVIDSVKLEDAVKGNEAALSVYGKELKSTNEVLAFSGKLMDSLTRLSHESMAQASDLIQILQQASGAAKNAKVDMDQLLGVGASAVRATGLQGQGGNLGRMLRTVFVQLSAPTKAIEESIEAIGVKMRDANGELRSAYDIILDLALATKDTKISQEELNEAVLAASSGKFQYSKLAATLGSFDEITKNVARSINSQGMTMQMAAQQLDTIERKAKSLHAVFIETFSGAGDTGLRTTLKSMIDVLEQTILGLNKVSSGAINAGLGLGSLLLAGKMIMGVYSRVTPIMAALSGTNAAIAASAGLAATGEISLATATNISSAAMSRLATTSALATGGLTLIAGAIALFVYKSGEARKAQLSLSQAAEDNITIGQQKIQQYQQEQDYLTKMAGYHQALQSQIESGTMSEEQSAQVKKDLTAIEEGLGIAIGEAALERLKAAGFTEQAIDDEKSAISSKSEAERIAVQNTIKAQNSQTQATIDGALQRIQALKEEGAALRGLLAAEKTFFDWGSTAYNREASMYESLAAGAESIGLTGFAENYRQTAEFSRQRAAEQQEQFNQTRQQETDRQMAEQEKIIADAASNLTKLQGQGLTLLPQDLLTHVPGGNEDASVDKYKETAKDVLEWAASFESITVIPGEVIKGVSKCP